MKEKLLEKKAELGRRFNELEEQRKAIEQEQYRLQGEHRIVEELLAEEEKAVKKEK